jgi:chromosome segregation ATPase
MATVTAKMEELVENLASAEFRLGEANRATTEAKQIAAQAQQEEEATRAKASELEARLVALKGRLDEKTRESRVLQDETQEKDFKLVKLRQDKKDSEVSLNKAYESTLDELTTLVDHANDQITELANDNHDLKFKLTEATRVVKWLEEKLANLEVESGGALASMKFRLTEANRVSKFYQSKLEMTPDEKEEEFKAILNSKGVELGRHQMKIDGLVEEVATIEHHLKETTKAAKSAKQEASQASGERESFKSKAYELASRLQAIKKLLQDKEELVQDLQGENKKLDDKTVSLKAEMRSTENMLNKSYNETLEGLTQHITETQGHIEEISDENQQLHFSVTEANRIVMFLKNKLDKLESESSQEIATLSFKYTEASRVSKFLEGKLMTIHDEKQVFIDALAEREQELAEVKSTLAFKESVLVMQEQNHKKTVEESTVRVRRVLALEGKLRTADRVASFLQTSLAEAETNAHTQESRPEDVAKMEVLSTNLVETHEVAELLQESLNMALLERQTMANRILELERQLEGSNGGVVEAPVKTMKTTEVSQREENLSAKLLSIKRFANTALQGIREKQSAALVQ